MAMPRRARAGGSSRSSAPEILRKLLGDLRITFPAPSDAQVVAFTGEANLGAVLAEAGGTAMLVSPTSPGRFTRQFQGMIPAA